MGGRNISRREFVRGSALVAGASVATPWVGALEVVQALDPLAEFGYGDVTLAAGLPQSQFEETQAILMGLDDDALLRPFRSMAGRPAPGRDIGGWYRYDPDYVLGKTEAGFAPGHSFGQWVSALSRGYAITGSQQARGQGVLRLNRLLAESMSGDYFEKTRFPAYSYDKLVCGLIDAQRFAGDPEAFATLGKGDGDRYAASARKGYRARRGCGAQARTPALGGMSLTRCRRNLFLAWERGRGRAVSRHCSAIPDGPDLL